MKRIAVVTGASAGLGTEFALQLDAMAGRERLAEIWLVARRRGRLDDLADRLRCAKGVAIEADLADPADVQRVGRLVREERAELAWLVNNAGFGTYGPFAETPIERALEEVDLNVRALTELSWLASKLLPRGGRLVNVASLAAFVPLGDFAVYAATKAYVHHFSLALAAELAPRGVSVTSLCPGPVSTEFALVASAGARNAVHGGKSAATVVRRCLRAARRGRWTSVPYLSWRLMTLLVRLLPKAAIAAASASFMKRPRAN